MHMGIARQETSQIPRAAALVSCQHATAVDFSSMIESTSMERSEKCLEQWMVFSAWNFVLLQLGITSVIENSLSGFEMFRSELQ